MGGKIFSVNTKSVTMAVGPTINYKQTKPTFGWSNFSELFLGRSFGLIGRFLFLNQCTLCYFECGSASIEAYLHGLISACLLLINFLKRSNSRLYLISSCSESAAWTGQSLPDECMELDDIYSDWGEPIKQEIDGPTATQNQPGSSLLIGSCNRTSAIHPLLIHHK